ncbi:ABC transporter permease subunit [Sporolactobacillus sp. STCC-11]|uniref:ABC transporter permease n=1 Tax=Sporolactobacillus caesalpiniae TaxID=3230362 RepID=UPI003394D18C
MELQTVQIQKKLTVKKKLNYVYLIQKNKMTCIGLGLLLSIVMLALLVPLISPYDPTKIDVISKFQSPSWKHWFGTDEVGRDLLTRTLYGARLSLGVGIVCIAIAGTVGLIVGSIAGYFGGLIDQTIMRIMDMMLAFPMLILAMALTAALGPSLQNALLALAIVEIPIYVRLARGQALMLRRTLYVRSAETFGIHPLRIIGRHVIPNAVSPLIIQATLDIGDAILMIATLGFLGLGAQPPTPEWGAMISVGWKYLLDYWWYPVFPGTFLFLSSMALNLIGDGIRDWLDPKANR